MKIFFDRNTCRRTARMLSIYEGTTGHLVRHHDDDSRFNHKSKDIEIIETLRDDDSEWIFMGGDGKILRNKVELATLANCDLTYILLNHSWCNKKIEEICWMMIKLWPKLTATVEKLKVHSILKLGYSGNCQIDDLGPTADRQLR